ncbi:triphosphoribosyl-dephospho-CoA synthase [Thalassoroseus pseudoceratinae]|uniref:triphosphoribosyl-dephospho-CoA synthase n=1 Tax=Thalassoroseus pseudoceratinae TaxID=2713176 RepID=UPI0014229CC9|nr:triphosphoribosyl-dephospho-CoA synthase [Thalassoroseus pseudoceratinae]
MSRSQSQLAETIQTACLLEATARKAGNVHPEAFFDDLCYRDFVNAAEVIAPILADVERRGVGQAVFDAISATSERTQSNANLGIVLLIAPLAAVPSDVSLESGIAEVLDRLTVDDSRLVYQAIRLANPGGMGRASEADISDEPTIPLKDAMMLAANRDMIARQYANNFADIFALLRLAWIRTVSEHWERGVFNLQLKILDRYGDSLIARKCGLETMSQASQRARHVLSQPISEQWLAAYSDFDRWLRADGNRRNPGTTADIIAATLFVVLRENMLTPPICPFPRGS